MPYPFYQQYPMFQQQIPQQIQQTNMLISVRNEMEARNYPVEPGRSITFKDENQPYIYVKTMGFSQLEVPRFDKYRLVKEENTIKAENGALEPQTNISTIDALKAEIKAIWGEITALKELGEQENDESEHE